MPRLSACDLARRYLDERLGLKAAFAKPGGAAGACYQASKYFAQWVRGLGQKRQVRLLLAQGRRTPCGADGFCRTTAAAHGWETACSSCETGHYVVEIEGCVVDLTAAQFGTTMPTVYGLDDLKAAWRHVQEEDGWRR